MNSTDALRVRPGPASRRLTFPALAFALALLILALIGARARAGTIAAEQIPAETKLTTPSGATFPIAAGWWLTRSDEQLLLETPERDMKLWFLELATSPEIADGEAAVREAWKRVRPDFSLAVERATNQPPTGGWDSITDVTYITPTEENRSVVGVSRRAGQRWYVQLLDGANGAFDRRGAQLGAALDGLEPPGLNKESFVGKTAHKLDDTRLAAYRAFLEQARIDCNVPGASVAIVQAGKVVFEEGFGVRELGSTAPVSPATLFMIGSTTKSLTTLLMAILVDKKKLAWETPVTALLPDFALGDSAMTRQLTVRHTVCACTGLPRQDMEFIFEFAGSSPESRLATMRTMKPTTGFGETFQYSNTLVSAGGYAAGRAAEPALPLADAYTRALGEYLLEPLGMTATTLDHARAVTEEHATPHAESFQLEMRTLPVSIEGAVVAVGPAGGAWSNLRDMEKVLLLELSGGVTPSGDRVVSKENLMRRREPQVKVSDTMNYGLGLFTGLETGAAICQHGGNTLGFTSDFFFLPDQGVGAVVLANAGGANAFRSAAQRKLLELLFDGRDEAGPRLAFRLAQAKKITAEEWAKLRPAEAEWIPTVTGVYHDDGLGKVEIRAGEAPAASSSVASAPNSASPVAPIFDAGEWQSSFMRRTEPDGAEKIVLLDPPMAGLDFIVSKDERGRPSFVLELPQQRYEFKRAD